MVLSNRTLRVRNAPHGRKIVARFPFLSVCVSRFHSLFPPPPYLRSGPAAPHGRLGTHEVHGVLRAIGHPSLGICFLRRSADMDTQIAVTRLRPRAMLSPVGECLWTDHWTPRRATVPGLRVRGSQRRLPGGKHYEKRAKAGNMNSVQAA